MPSFILFFFHKDNVQMSCLNNSTQVRFKQVLRFHSMSDSSHSDTQRGLIKTCYRTAYYSWNDLSRQKAHYSGHPIVLVI